MATAVRDLVGGELRETDRPDAPAESFFTPARVAWGMTFFLWLGLAARAVRYLLRFPLWEDECFLCSNFIDRSFAELLDPLSYHQVAPPLFLWTERAMVLLFGYSEWSLRLVPFAAGIASLFLFRRLASRLLAGPALLLAFGAFAVSYPGIRYSAEAKQYSTDLLAALVLLTFAVEWRRTGRTAWLWALAAATPPLLWLSYPAAFAVGGVSLAIGAVLLRPLLGTWATDGLRVRVKPSAAAAWVAFNVAILAGFGALTLAVRRQSGATLGFMIGCWRDAFPPLGEPLRLPAWLVEIHTSDLLAWPVGGPRGASAATAALATIGLWRLLRKRDAFWGLLLLAPAGLNLVAAAIQRYPYGGHVKFSMYFGPAVCLLAGWGAAAWNESTSRFRPRLARNAAALTVALIAAVAFSSIARDVARPYKTLSDERARSFARWFWFNAGAQGPVSVVADHAGRPFSTEDKKALSWTAMFLCNRAIYEPTTPAPLPAKAAGAARPVRCLVYRDPGLPFDAAARDSWLADMTAGHDLAAADTFPFTRYDKRERTLVAVDYLDIYTFRPKDAQMVTAEGAARR